MPSPDMESGDERASDDLQPPDEAAFSVDDFFIASWGLAHEERPMHALWSGDVDAIELHVPEPLDVQASHSVEGKSTTTRSTPTARAKRFKSTPTNWFQRAT